MIDFLRKYKLLLLSLFLLFITVVVVQTNYNKNNLKSTHVDESVTLIPIKYQPGSHSYRALNGSRVFTHLFYPVALVGMIKHMGGNVYTDGDDHTGHMYIQKNFNGYYRQIHKNKEDPNLRYFSYYIKAQVTLFLFASLIPLIFLFWKRKRYATIFLLALLLGINYYLMKERSIYYIEPLLLGIMNILIWLYFYLYQKKKLNLFWILIISFVSVFTVSVKFSSLIFVFLLFLLIPIKSKGIQQTITNILIYIFGSVLFFILINWDPFFYGKKVISKAIHDLTFNIWNYSVGFSSVPPNNYKLFNLWQYIKVFSNSIGWFSYLLPFSLIVIGRLARGKEKYYLLGFVITFLISVYSIVTQRVYILRNAVPFLTAAILITGLTLDLIIDAYIKKREGAFSKKIRIGFYGLVFLLIVAPLTAYSKNRLHIMFPNAKSNTEKALSNIKLKENRRLVQIDYNSAEKDKYKEAVEFESMPEVARYTIKPYFEKFKSKIRSTDVVVISEVGNNKQLANYLLPKLFNNNKQFSNHHIYYNTAAVKDAVENKTNTILWKGMDSIRNDLALEKVVFISGNKGKSPDYLGFKFKSNIANAIVGCRFYLHGFTYLKDKNSLPKNRIQYGFDNWDYTVKKGDIEYHDGYLYLTTPIKPTLDSYAELRFGIFSGCPKSKRVALKDVSLR